MKKFIIDKIVGFKIAENQRIHLKNRFGMYTVHKIHDDGIEITCRVWQARRGYPKKLYTEKIPFKEVKCKAGNINGLAIMAV